MECSLAALTLCFSWANFYIDGGLAYQDAGMYHEIVRETPAGRYAWQYDKPANPYGSLSIGYELQLEKTRWRLWATHVSSVASNEDRGINSVGISAQWFPFR